MRLQHKGPWRLCWEPLRWIEENMNKIDFAIVVTAEMCNPNGDPLNGNRPRTDFEGHGYITDVAIKRKIRNRLQDAGESILVVENSRSTDGLFSIKDRVRAQKELMQLEKVKDINGFYGEACRTWIDVRAFGQMFPFKDLFGGTTIPVRGPVSVGMARSLQTVDILDYTISKSCNSEENSIKKDSSTIGARHVVSKAAYVAYGSIFPQLADKTGFSENDAELIKNAMATLFENDASAARPSGSMTAALYWWEHDCPTGRKSSALVHKSLNIAPMDKYPYYACDPDSIAGIKLSIL